jgi:hypothetical protein
VTGKGRITRREKSIEWTHGDVGESRGEFGGDGGPRVENSEQRGTIQ